MIEIRKSWKYRPYYCKDNYIQVDSEEKDLYTSEDGEWTIIGFPGVDGMDFRIKTTSNSPTVYAHYPYENRNVEIAGDISDLIEKWKNHQIVL